MKLSSRFSLIALTLIAVLTAEAVLPAAPVHAAAKPNILFILTDDLDLAEIAFMPKLKSLLIDQGATFDNYFASVSLCCPSRSTTLRGQYSHNTGVLTNGGGNGGFERAYADGIEKSTIATWLKDGGYQTGLFGKYLNGYPHTASDAYIPPGWVDWNSAVKGNPYAEYNYTLNENGKFVDYKLKPEDYGTDVYAKQANGFIQQSIKNGQPFFVYLAVYAPHQPATPAPRHKDLFPNAQAPRTPNYNETDVSDKPEYISARPQIGPVVARRIDDLYRRRLQSLQAVDEAISMLYDTLKANNQLDNTYIVFTSDNGFHLGNHRLPAGKQTAYEEDIHLPLIVRGPNVPAGAHVSQITGNIDLAPTFADMAGVKPGDFVDGRSFLPLATGKPPTTWRQAYLVEHWAQGPEDAGAINQEPPDEDQSPAETTAAATATPAPKAKGPLAKLAIPEFHGIRVNGYTYVEYVTGEKELYDLTKDPYELTNLAPKSNPTLLKQFSDRVAVLVSCKADSCRAAEDQPLEFNTASK
jgi:N-acetylglucosamine-6-sulfatase